MAGLSNAKDFQVYIMRGSSFYDAPSESRIFELNDEFVTANVYYNCFSDLCADPAVKGLVIERFIISFSNGETWDGTNHFSFALDSDREINQAMFEWHGSVAGAAGRRYVDMLDYPFPGSDAPATYFTEGQEGYQLNFTMSGTATINDVNVLIQYRPLVGANPSLGTETAGGA